MAEYRLTTPLDDDVTTKLNIGDRVLLSGKIYTARDAAHKRMLETINAGGELPFDLKGQVIYYVGPAPAKPGRVIGPAGPTTSGRMDSYTLPLLARGLKGMVGKGFRSPEVISGLRQYKAVYFAAVGGAAALIARKIKKCELVAYPDLGPEAIYELEVEEFPVVVVNDTNASDLYREGRKKYSKEEL